MTCNDQALTTLKQRLVFLKAIFGEIEASKGSSNVLGAMAMRRFSKDERIALMQLFKLTEIVLRYGKPKKTYKFIGELLQKVVQSYTDYFGAGFWKDTKTAEQAIRERFSLTESSGPDTQSCNDDDSE